MEGPLLGQLFLDVSARGSSLAQRLIEASERELYEQGIREAELHCLVGNERAKRFYEHQGWRITEIIAETIQSDVDGEHRDFWVLRKRLTSHVLQPPLQLCEHDTLH